MDQKRSILQYAHAHQYQLHPLAVKQLVETLSPLNADTQQTLLRTVFSALYDECVGGDRTITPAKMTKAIAVSTDLSNRTAKGTKTSVFQVVGLDQIPALDVDETTDSVTPVLASSVSNGRMNAYHRRFKLALQRCFRSGRYRRGAGSVGIEGQRPLVPIASLDGLQSRDAVSVLGVLSFDETLQKFAFEDTKNRMDVDLVGFQRALTCYIGQAMLVIVTGRWTGSKFAVENVELPPAEARLSTLAALGSADTFGLAPADLQRAAVLESSMLSSVCVVIAHVHLDSAKCVSLLSKFFSAFESRREDELSDMCFVVVGDFTSQPWSLGDIGHMGDQDGRHGYYSLLELFGSVVHQVAPSVALHSSFVFVPGPNDPTGVVGVLPQVAIPSALTVGLRSRIKKASFAPNPCRLRFLTHEMVFCRKNFFHDFQTHALKWNRIAGTDHSGNVVDADAQPLAQYELVTKTICDSAHLSPLEANVMWRYDSALGLTPLPQLLVLCDKTEQWQCSYRGATVVNPGSFTTSGTFLWYTPCDREVILNQVS